MPLRLCWKPSIPPTALFYRFCGPSVIAVTRSLQRAWYIIFQVARRIFGCSATTRLSSSKETTRLGRADDLFVSGSLSFSKRSLVLNHKFNAHCWIAYPEAQGIRIRTGRKCRSDFCLRQNGSDENENGPAKMRSHLRKKGKCSLQKRKRRVPENFFAFTISETDARNLAVADVRFSPRHQEGVDLGEDAAEQGGRREGRW